MTGDEPFLDYYDILQVNPNCDGKILESAYHYLAKLHHPDHSGLEDTDKFNEVTEAYRVLRDPDRRAAYDRVHAQHRNGATYHYPTTERIEIEDTSAADDADNHAKILMYLYKQRREDAQNPGVVGFYVQNLIDCSDEEFEFHKWYLKEKGYIVLTEQGTIAITIHGVEHVISMARTTKAEKLMIGRSSAGPADDEGDAEADGDERA